MSKYDLSYWDVIGQGWTETDDKIGVRILQGSRQVFLKSRVRPFVRQSHDFGNALLRTLELVVIHDMLTTCPFTSFWEPIEGGKPRKIYGITG